MHLKMSMPNLEKYKPFMIMSYYTTYENVPNVVQYPPYNL